VDKVEHSRRNLGTISDARLKTLNNAQLLRIEYVVIPHRREWIDDTETQVGRNRKPSVVVEAVCRRAVWRSRPTENDKPRDIQVQCAYATDVWLESGPQHIIKFLSQLQRVVSHPIMAEPFR
jgi:hypothetical protein